MAQEITATKHKRNKMLIFDPTQPSIEEGGTVNRKKRVAAYAHVSTELDSQQNSYEAQIDYYSAFIQENPEWEFAGIYSDEGITGTSYKRRDGFNKMVEDASAGLIDLILTKSISRFARNTVDALTITRQLKTKGVEVRFEKENISSMDTTAELIFTIMSSIAQEESRSISENVRWGIQRCMEAGRVILPWKSFLGYEKGPDGLPQINEEEAAVVRDIYHDYLDGHTLRGIARDLAKRGVKSPCSKQNWSPETVRNILTNEKYKGDAILQKTYTVDFLSKEVRVNHGERKQWYIQDSHDAIITADAFRQVQSELKFRAKRYGKHIDSPLTDKLVCGVCRCKYAFRKWDLEKEHQINRWICGVCYKANPDKEPIKFKENQIKKAFMIAVNRLLADAEWPVDRYKEIFTPIFAGFDGSGDGGSGKHGPEAFQNAVEALEPSFLVFDPHLWHTLLEYAKITSESTILFIFRNGRKETIDLMEK